MFQRFAVFGNPIDHSLSPIIHQCFSEQFKIPLLYEKIKALDESFENLVSDFFSQDGKGLNITAPFKQKAFDLAQRHTERCTLAGAVNTLWMSKNQVQGDNTDGIGFIRDLGRYMSVQGKRVLVLGAGGAARGIIQPLLANNPLDLIVANRTLIKATELQYIFPQIHSVGLNEIKGCFDLVINATSAEFSGELISLPEDFLAQKPFCYDLYYKQKEATAFVHYARNKGCFSVDGLGMLAEQAAESFFIWHGIRPDTKEVLAFLRK